MFNNFEINKQNPTLQMAPQLGFWRTGVKVSKREKLEVKLNS